MLKRIAIVLVLLALAAMVRAQTPSPIYYGLNGVITNAVGQGFTGTLSVELARSSAANICTSPVSIVAMQPAVYQLVNGAIVNGTSAQFLTNDCLSPAVPYFAQIFDASKKRVYADNWYFPRMSISNVNVGTVLDVGFQTGTQSTATPIVVAIPSAIVATPAGQQTITQPGTTSLTINNLAVTGTFSSTNAIAASITGNSATATALAASPSQCASGYFATGITANGTANCSNAFPSNSSFGSLQVTGALNAYSSQGEYLNWNQDSGGGLGESDFINNHGLGSNGGFRWYDTPAAGTPVSLLLILDVAGNVKALGDLYAATGGTGTVHGSTFTGNSATATALAASPSQCSAGNYATGITASGNANCSALGGTSRTCNSNGCYNIEFDGTIKMWGNTADLGGSGSVFINFPTSFSHACQTVVVSTVSNTDRITILNATSGSVPCSPTGFTVGSNGSSSSASWIAFGY